MKEYDYLLGRYAFQTAAQMEEAKREEEAIAYIKGNTDLSNVKNAYALYNKFNEKPSFKTQVGLEFMQQLFDVIVGSGLIQAENIEHIKLKVGNPLQVQAIPDAKEVKQRNTKAEEKLSVLQRKHKNLWIITGSLVVVIAAMFFIARYSDYSMISDYETQILNKYSEWEEELQQREQKIKDLENKKK